MTLEHDIKSNSPTAITTDRNRMYVFLFEGGARSGARRKIFKELSKYLSE